MASEAITSKADGTLQETIQWFASLEPGFAFLLALPFLVALAGFFGEYLKRRRENSMNASKAL